MANQLKMATVQSILSLHEKRWSYRRIARELGVDRGTVARYVRLAAQAAQAEHTLAEPDGEAVASKPANAPTRLGAKSADAASKSANPGRLDSGWKPPLLKPLQAARVVFGAH